LLRYLKYDAILVEDSEANNGIYANKHTDMGTLTLNFPWLDCRFSMSMESGNGSSRGKMRLLSIVGDALAARTGGYFKSGLHRVHAPPKEQIHLDRWAALFFLRYGIMVMTLR